MLFHPEPWLSLGIIVPAVPEAEEPVPTEPVSVAVPFVDPVVGKGGAPDNVCEPVSVRLPSVPVMNPDAVLFHPEP